MSSAPPAPFPALFPALAADPGRPALRFGERSLTYGELAAAAGALVPELSGAGISGAGGRVAVWATPTLETAVGVVAALLAGVPVVPLNPKVGERELAHILGDSAPKAVLAGPGEQLPAALDALARTDVEVTPGTGAPDRPVALPAEPDPESPALIVYTSGTTGPPKGAVLPAVPSPRAWTRWRTPGSGRRTTCWCTGCRCSMCTA